MKTVLAAASFFAFVAFVPRLSDATKRPSAKDLCKFMHISDPLRIGTCMRHYFDLCAIGAKSDQILTNSSVKFGTCLGKSIYSYIFNSSFSLPKKTEVCRNKLTTNFLKFDGIDDCFSQLGQICTRWNDDQGARNLLLIVPGAKCILERQRKYADPALWQQVACSALGAFRNETMPPLIKIVDFFDRLLGCVRPPPPPAC